ncbi:MAG: phosphoenolpyruvate carboxykinase (ATP) [bacterium]|nr:phosphoenolpyruvate carboxykinase (ATP) [bacterium]
MQGMPPEGFYSLENHGIKNAGKIYWTPTTPELYQEAVARREGLLAHLGPLVVRTGHYTGRSPNDKFLVMEPTSKDKIWWGKVNRPFEEEQFNRLHARLMAYLQGKDLFVQDCYVGADPNYRLPIRVITERAWHNLFARNMFIHIEDRTLLSGFVPEFTLIDMPGFHAVPELDGTNSEAFILVDFGKKLVIIGGTSYAGEIKKSVFTILNYLLPQQGVLSMHCSANVGPKGDVAVFFGLSGTGKTTLSADPMRNLIGDDEHGWSDEGIFNFEGGCYAKVIRLSEEAEPEIYAATRFFGTILENVGIDGATHRVNLDDDTFTENTRAAYSIDRIPNAVINGVGAHPKHVIMLTADAFGIMPPIARLTPRQAEYHFLSGYTAKIAGTERGMGDEPEATFSACFGAPFMALKPSVYAELLEQKITKHKAACWLVNTGWIGGGYGAGERISIQYTRTLLNAALEGKLDNAPMRIDPTFGFEVPAVCDGIPSEILDPRENWKDKSAYDRKAKELANRFVENFKDFDAARIRDVVEAGPKVQ